MSLSLTSEWFIRTGQETAARQALIQLAADVQAGEPGTLAYLVHTPFGADGRLISLPPTDPLSVLFFETYADPDAFLAHLDGPIFTAFVAEHGADFVSSNGRPYTTVRFLNTLAGFAGRGADTAAEAVAEAPANAHPAVMFELIAKDAEAAKTFYQAVFGWRYQLGTGGFAYVHFPPSAPPRLGGIGQAEPDTPSFAPGHNFYLLVEALEPVLDRVLTAGGAPLMPPTAVDGYRFAMFRDPEGNPIGLIEPFSS